jgi:TatA/E family protein of Tat protein translocase
LVLSPLATLGLTSILLIVLLVVLLFGSSQIPRFFRSLGQLRGEYRRGKKDDTSGRS